tara:strand:+ start:18103 stop:18840 length:738 start_codon:yes stop_codon:yes gene_type:complete
MAWRFPKHRVSDDSVIEIDGINENFRGVVEEGSGELNEHNWKVSSWPDRLTDLSDGVAVRYKSRQVGIDPASGSGSASTFVAQDNPTWQLIDQLTETITSTGGDFWILASFQVRAPWYQPDILAIGTGGYFSAFGLQFALRVDGKVLTDSIIGSGDLSNDLFVSESLVTSPPGGSILSFNSPGVTATYASVSTEAITTLAPGAHTVEVVAMSPNKSKLPNSEDTNFDKYAKMVTVREMIILELRR